MKSIILVAVLLWATIATAHAEKQCYEAQATVKQAAPSDKCTQTEKGYANSGKGPLTHDGCTAAKSQAATKLRARLQESCQAYVQTFDSCTVIAVKSCE
jgi:hypothetical protein